MTASPDEASARELIRMPEVRALLAARGLGAIGMSATATVVAFQTYAITGEPLALGLLGLVEAIPALGLMLFGGHVADRYDRRSILLVTGSMVAAGVLALALLSLDPAALGLVGVLAVAFLIGVAAGFERPARTAFETQVIPIAHATRGASLAGSVWMAGAILGPALGGLAVAVIGTPATFALLAAIIGLAVLSISRIAPKPMPAQRAGEPIATGLASGVRYVARSQVLLGAMALDLFAVFFGGAIALLPVFASDVLHVGPVGLGLLRTAPAVGALVAMLVTTRVAPKQRAGRILLGAVATFGVSMLAFGLSTEFLVSLGALFVAGLADGVSVVIRIVILRVESPEDMRGRIAAVNHVFIGASNELGAFESGVAATLLGVVPSVLFGGVVTLAVVAAVGVLLPELRRLDLGRRLVEGPGARPVTIADAQGAAAEVERITGTSWGTPADPELGAAAGPTSSRTGG